MGLLTISSPHTHGGNKTSKVMLTVILATLPGVLVMTWLFGWGTLINILWASALALLSEAVMLKLRNRPIVFFLKDNSAILTAVLLGIALPPFAPYWVTAVAVIFAIVFAKHLYGGLGNNPFNPAMVGYALVLISFPVEMTTNWASANWLNNNELLSFGQTLSVIFAGTPVTELVADSFSGATPLDTYKHLASTETADVIMQNTAFGTELGGWFAGGWEYINLAFLAGGLVLLALKIFTWHIPVSMLASLFLCSAILGWDADLYVPFSLHLLSGATMLGAFFIATDPVSASTTPLGKIIYGAGIGIFVYIIRTWGAYPDAIAFAVLLMNFAAPLIDAYTQPRAYGHEKAKRGPKPTTNEGEK